jgi:peptidoglycan/LPS O-acetylase OafA/YrhL
VPHSRDNNFDLLRLLAASQVVATHLCEHLRLHPVEGQFALLFQFVGLFPGVPIFFAISGFLISRSFEARRNDLRGYAVNRGLRIFPALWACFALSLICMSVLGALTPSTIATPSFLLYFVGQTTIGQFYTPDFLKSYGVGNPNGSLWTIPVEIQFYIALPILYWIGKRLSGKAFDGFLLAVAALAFAAGSIASSQPKTMATLLFGATFIPHIWMFIVGVLIARNFQSWASVIEGKGFHWLAGYVALRLALMPLQSHVVDSAVYVLLAFAVISLAYTGRNASRKMLREVDISYGVYLYHMVIINVLVQTNNVGPGWPVVATILATFALAYLSFRFIERPALALKGMFMKRNEATATA